jgi:signal transduction histidine kinase
MDPLMPEGPPFVSDPALVTDEEALRALETDLRLAAHLRALSRVSVATAHDIRTPLHTMVLYLELLRRTIADKSGPDTSVRQERYLDVIGSEIQRLEQMVVCLLGQTRVAEETSERFDLVGAARDIHGFLDPYCRRAKVRVSLTLPDTTVLVEGNRDSIQQALIHIFMTIVEAFPDGGDIGMSVAAGRGKAVFLITGAGPGMPAAILDGSSGAPPTNRAFGAERGLYVARRVVERHGGSIKVRSGGRPGTGASLEIQLPLAAPEG